MDLTITLNQVIYGVATFIVGVLVIDLWLDYRWSRKAQTMHATVKQR